MFDRPDSGERAILVQIVAPSLVAERALLEFQELAVAAQAKVVAVITGSRDVPDAKYYVGLGKALEIKDQVIAYKADLVLVNHELSPSQERNLERFLETRVVGRSGLILAIFAQRARTFEGKLQVELAQLQYSSTRLIRGWTHLERQKGGIGLNGPGETQLETDRRLLRERVKVIKKRLEKVKVSRAQNRASRGRASLANVSLVGYTNAGKSSLFNSLTHEQNFVASQVFATLDPTMRRIKLPFGSEVILADTVGFIRDLPHHLIDAFRATLEETKDASLLLHVIDISEDNWQEQREIVEKVLTKLNVASLPMILVFNKIDKLNSASVNVLPDKSEQQPLVNGFPLPNGQDLSGETLTEAINSLHINLKPSLEINCPYVFVSAKTGEGLELLREAIVVSLYGEVIEEEVYILASQTKLRAKLYAIGAVLHEVKDDDGGSQLKIRLTKAIHTELFK